MASSSANPEVDRVTALAANIFGVPVCIVALQTEGALWFVSQAGTHLVTWPEQTPNESPIQTHFDGLWQAPDDEAVLPLTFPRKGRDKREALRFVASAPIQGGDGRTMGALLLLDWQPHPHFGRTQLGQLQQLAALAQDPLLAWHDRTDLFARATQERLQLALESAQMGTWDFDFQSQERIINHRTASMLGFGHGDVTQTTMDSWLHLVHPDDRHKIVEATQIYRKGLSDIISIEYRMRHQNGQDIWVQSYGKLVERDHRGRPKRVVGTLRDITDQKRREVLQHKQRQLLDLINQAQASFLINHDIKDACEALFAPLLHLSECQFGLIGVVRHSDQGVPYLVVPTMTQEVHAAPFAPRSHEYFDLNNLFGRVVTSNEAIVVQDGTQHGVTQIWPDGVPPLHNFLGLPIRFDNEVVGLIGLGNRNQVFDSTLLDLLAPLASTLGTLIHARHQEEARMEAEQEWLRLATEDALTGLPNRRHFFDVAETCLLQTRRYGNPMTIALLDLDNFKQINDTYGHSAGDEVLRVLADILRQALRDSDTPARIGGEEFAVILTSTSLEDSLIALERIRATLSLTPITMGKRTLHATVSIGAVQWHPQEHEHVHGMLQQADAALYRAKRRGRNRVEVHQAFDAEPMNETPHDTGWGLLGLA